MKKLITLTMGLLLLGGLNRINAQDMEYHHGLGGTYSMLMADVDGFAALGTPSITYHARLAMELDRDLSLSLSAPVSLGFYIGSGAPNYLVYELPLAVDLNFGFASLERSRSDFGGFAGAGYGLYGVGTSGGGGNIHGLYAHVGGRFIINEFPIALSVFTYQTFDFYTVYGGRIVYELSDFR